MTKKRFNKIGLYFLSAILFSPSFLAGFLFSFVFLINSLIVAFPRNWYKYGFKKASRTWYKDGFEFFKRNLDA